MGHSTLLSSLAFLHIKEEEKTKRTCSVSAPFLNLLQHCLGLVYCTNNSSVRFKCSKKKGETDFNQVLMGDCHLPSFIYIKQLKILTWGSWILGHIHWFRLNFSEVGSEKLPWCLMAFEICLCWVKALGQAGNGECACFCCQNWCKEDLDTAFHSC